MRNDDTCDTTFTKASTRQRSHFPSSSIISIPLTFIILSFLLLFLLSTCHGFDTTSNKFYSSYLILPPPSLVLSSHHYRAVSPFCHGGIPNDAYCRAYPSIQLSQSTSGNGEDIDGELTENERLHESLRRATNDRLGAPIPIDPSLASSAEDDFLRAMVDAKDEFNEARNETGSTDGAVAKVMGRIEREEVERIQKEEAVLEEVERRRNEGGGMNEEGGGDEFQ